MSQFGFQNSIFLEGYKLKNNIRDYSYQTKYNSTQIKEKINFGWLINDIEYYLKYDKFEKFQELYFKNPTFYTIVDDYEFRIDKGNYSLISLSALYSSIKCFKFLLNQQNYSLNNDNFLGKFALIGGNIEIINILENNSFNLYDNNSLNICSQYKHFKLVKRLIKKNYSLNLNNFLSNNDFISFFYFFDKFNVINSYDQDVKINLNFWKYFTTYSF